MIAVKWLRNSTYNFLFISQDSRSDRRNRSVTKAGPQFGSNLVDVQIDIICFSCNMQQKYKFL